MLIQHPWTIEPISFREHIEAKRENDNWKKNPGRLYWITSGTALY